MQLTSRDLAWGRCMGVINISINLNSDNSHALIIHTVFGSTGIRIRMNQLEYITLITFHKQRHQMIE